MNLEFSEEQDMLRDMVRGVCAEYAPVDTVRELEDDPIGYPAELWKQLGELDLLGVAIPEAYGGSEQGMMEQVIVYEELGRSLAPTPHFVSCILSAGAINLAGSEDQKKELLPKIASGEAIVSVAWLEPKNGFGPKGVQVRAERDGDDYVLTGSKWHVAFGKAATHFLVVARTGVGEGDLDLLLVDASSPGISLEQQMTISSDTQYEVKFEGVRVPAARRLGAEGSGWQTWDAVMHDGIILAAALATGGSAQALEMTVEYAKEREQFDKPLGAFQSIAHYLADAATAVDGAAILTYEAAMARVNGKPIERLAPMAKLFACQTYRDLTAVSLQIYGGVGFTVEYDAQLYFRRAKQLQLSWWGAKYLEELVAKQALDD